MSYEPLHHKYRPQTFTDLVGQDAIATTLTNALNRERIAPAYLFTGPRGTGKTSSARILAKSLNCLTSDKPTEFPCGRCEVCLRVTSGSALDVIEIDAASNTGVDNIREIIERAQFAPVQCRYKVYIIDEVHMLSTAAFNALLKTLEEPPARIVFVLATTDPQRVLPTIISRCQRFDFRRIPLQAMVQHLQDIAAKETIDITPEAITLVAQVAQGGLRDAESLLDQLSLLSGQVTVERVWDLVGAVPEQDLLALAQALNSDHSEAVLTQCRTIMDRGREPLIVLQQLAGFYRDVLIAKTAPSRHDLVAVTSQGWNNLREFAQPLDISSILQAQQHLKTSEAQIKNTTQPRLWLEVTLLGLLPSALSRPAAPSTPMVARNEAVRPSQPPSKNQPEIRRDSAPQVQQPAPSPSPEIHTAQKPTPSASVNVSPPVPSESTPTPAAQHTTASEDKLDSMWQQVLNHLPRSTQELLRQHCELVAFEGSVAQIGISTQPLLKLAQSKLSTIEVAFAAVCQTKVTVRLQQAKTFKSTHPTPDAPVNRSSTSDRQPIESTAAPTTPNPTRSNSPANEQARIMPSERVSPVMHSPATQQPAEPVTVHGNPSVSQSPSPTEQFSSSFHPSSQLATSGSQNSTFEADVNSWESDAVEKALGSLNQFFEGEIIDLSDDFPLIESVISTQSPLKAEINTTTAELPPEIDVNEPKTFITHQHQPHLNTTFSIRPDLPEVDELEDDDDIPF